MRTTVDELMEAAVVVADPGDTVGEVREKMTAFDIGAVPVVDATGALVGILTADDLVSDYPTTLPVSRIMSTPVSTLEPKAGVGRAAAEMRRHRRHHAVVVRDGAIVGILSSWDLIGLLERVESPAP